MSACRAELCPYWPGHGCVSGVMPCEEQSRTACCPRETIPDSCSCPDGCECLCADCDCPADDDG